MNEYLTQKDIDALLQGAAAPVSDEARVVPYSFVRPPRVRKDLLAALQTIYGGFAQTLQGVLSLRLRTPTDVTVAGIEQIAFTEFHLSLASPCAVFVFKLGERRGMVEIGNDLAFFLVDRMFGGPGEPTELRRPLTPLEQGVVRGLVERALSFLRDAWQGRLPITPEGAAFESDPDELLLIPAEDKVLVVILDVRAGASGGFMTVCVPAAAVEAILRDKAAVTAAPSGPGAADVAANQVLLKAGLKNAHVTVAARMPAVLLSAREVADLKAGQVLRTGHPVDTPVEVHINGRLRFLASLGQIRRRIGLRVSRTVAAAIPDRQLRSKEGRVT